MAASIYTEEGQHLALSVEIGRGGEGAIFASPRTELECARLYLVPVSNDTRAKLSIMIERPPVDPTYDTVKNRSISWPTTLIYRDNVRQSCAGFFMPKIDLKVFQKALVYIEPSDRSKRFGGGFTWKHLYTAANNVASALAAVHEQSYCVGDLNESNILIAPNALAALIDCDSFQVPDPKSRKTYRCMVGKPEYTAPELMGKRYEDVERTAASDCFALGVFVFQLLMEGTHPYQAKGKLVEDVPNTESKIKRGHFPYTMRGRDIAPPNHAPPYEILHPELQRYFERCFVAGHGDPKARPTAREWHELFRKLERRFVVCPDNPNHCFLNHLRSCPWCDLKKKNGHDPFLSPVGQQIALESATGPLDSLENRIAHLQSHVTIAFLDGVLTSEEESYLLARGAELEISTREVQKVIEAEARRVQGKRGSAAGTPLIEVSRKNFAFENVRRGNQVSGSYVINNVGGGSLQGKVSSKQSWLKLSQSLIDASRHRQEHGFIAETSGLALGSKNSGFIEMETNGGNAEIHVAVSVEIEKQALSRFRRRLFWLGMLLGGIFGYFSYLSLPDTPSRAAVSGVAGLVGLVGAIVAASRSGGFVAGCGTFLIGAAVLTGLETELPHAYAAVSWALTFGSVLHTFARSMFVAKESGKAGAFAGTAAALIFLVGGIVVAGTSLKDLIRAGGFRNGSVPVQMGTVSTCKKATGWRHFTAKSQFQHNESICVYADVLNVNRGGKIDLTYTVNLKNLAGAGVLSDSSRFTGAGENAWYHWPALHLPPSSPPGTYIAEVTVRNNLTAQTGTSAVTFTVLAAKESTPVATPTSGLEGGPETPMPSSAPCGQTRHGFDYSEPFWQVSYPADRQSGEQRRLRSVRLKLSCFERSKEHVH